MEFINEWAYLAGISESHPSPKKSDKDFEKFAAKRRDGAQLLASEARSRGGAAKLTAEHFEAKGPIYRKAADGHFDRSDAEAEYRRLLSRLSTLPTDPMEFQRLTGKLEALGELLIGPRNLSY